MTYNPNDDRITLPITALFDMLRTAAENGIQVGEKGTKGDHTESGIAYTVFREYMRNREPAKPNPQPAFRSNRPTIDDVLRKGDL